MISFSREVQPPHSKDFFQKQFKERDEDFMMLICTPKSPTYQCSQQPWDVLEWTALQLQSEQCRPPVLTPGEVWKLQDLTYQVWSASWWVTPVLAAWQLAAVCFDFVADQCVLPSAVYLSVNITLQVWKWGLRGLWEFGVPALTIGNYCRSSWHIY